MAFHRRCWSLHREIRRRMVYNMCIGGVAGLPPYTVEKVAFPHLRETPSYFSSDLPRFTKFWCFQRGAGYRGSRYATAILIAFSSFHQRMCCMPETLLSIISNSICVCRTNKKYLISISYATPAIDIEPNRVYFNMVMKQKQLYTAVPIRVYILLVYVIIS